MLMKKISMRYVGLLKFMRKISLSKPCISEESINDVVHVLKSGWLTQGKKVVEFENQIKQELGVQYALAVNSATSGLHIALLSLGVGIGDEVIVPAFTWVATANVVELCGAKPIFVDIDPRTLNADLNQILLKITSKTKAIIVVHLFGKPFNVEILKEKLPINIPIVEDAACALGASIEEKFCGAMADIGVFSFHPRKSITTGEGGLVVTNNVELHKEMNMLRNHGQDCTQRQTSPADMFDCPIVGFNYRMTDFQAALGVQQFSQLNPMIDYRKRISHVYEAKLSTSTEIGLPCENAQERHSWQSYVVSISSQEKRDDIMIALSVAGIETRPGTHAVHLLSYFKKKYDLKAEHFPNSYNAFKSTISLPLHNHMTADDAVYVSENFLEIIHAAY